MYRYVITMCQFLTSIHSAKNMYKNRHLKSGNIIYHADVPFSIMHVGM